MGLSFNTRVCKLGSSANLCTWSLHEDILQAEQSKKIKLRKWLTKGGILLLPHCSKCDALSLLFTWNEPILSSSRLPTSERSLRATHNSCKFGMYWLTCMIDLNEDMKHSFKLMVVNMQVKEGFILSGCDDKSDMSNNLLLARLRCSRSGN